MSKLIVFDLDGVLIDSREANYEAFARGIEAAGKPRPAVDSVVSLIGLAPLEMMRRLGCPEERVEELYDRVVAPFYLDNLHQLARPVRQAREVLSALRAQGHRLVACTSGDRAMQEKALNGMGLLDLLEAMQTPNDSRYRKPQVEFLGELIEQVGHEGPVVHIEDSHVGLQMGLQWGATTVFADYGFGHPGELQPHYRISCLTELPRVVAAL